MSKAEEIRAELGAQGLEMLMDDYYASDVPLKDLREYHGLPSNYSDDGIVALFPPMKLHEKCPVCGMSLIANHISRGVADATSGKYYTKTVRCSQCDKFLTEIERELEEERVEIALVERFSKEPNVYDWKIQSKNSREAIVFGSLLYEKSLMEHQYFAPISAEPHYTDFLDSLKSLYASSFIEPTYCFPDWRAGFELDKEGKSSFWWYKVPFSVSVTNYSEEKPNAIKTVEEQDAVALSEAECDVWLKTCVGFLVKYLYHNLEDLGYEPSEKTEAEFVELLPILLRSYSPAQIASQIWSVTAMIMKRESERYESWKKTGAYATGAVINRLKKALNESWDLKPNIPTAELRETFFEEYFFTIHVPVGSTWVYRKVPEFKSPIVVIPIAKMPELVNKTTPAMIDFAQAIAEKLEVPEPDYMSYESTGDFITRYRNDFEAHR